MSLKQYDAKRDFRVSPEPPGEARAGRADAGLRFVVQLHHARRRHFDLRLELDGVLKSWAVPKGPSDDAGDKRLAVAVEDHPLAYAEFEGVIPAGQYGAGAVLVWDRGVWVPAGDPHVGLRNGKLRFELFGQRLRGGWTLVRTPGEDAKQWLLIKKRDAAAVRGATPASDRFATSVVTGRTLDAVRNAAAAPGRQRANAPPAKRAAANTQPPRFIPPMLATPADRPPAGEGWLHEIKLDGYRMQLRLLDGQATWRSRNGHDWTERMPELSAEAQALPTPSAVIDGELVVLDAHGHSDFLQLQQALRTGRSGKLVFYAFDLLWNDDGPLTGLELATRKRRLAALLPGGDHRLRYLDHVVGRGEAFFRLCREQGLEGSVAKRADRPYRSGRGRDWLKCKAWERAVFVIGGWDRSPDALGGLGALLLGYFASDGRLVYAGRVGTGLDERAAGALRAQLAASPRDSCPFSPPLSRREAKGAAWTEPRAVVEVRFAGATGAGRIRQGTVERPRPELSADGVVRDAVVPDRAEDPPARAEPARPAGADRRAAEPRPLDAEQQAELRALRLTNPDRILYPDVGLTKADLIRYYVQVAPWMMRHVAGRPLSLVRCPQGAGRKCFFQKRVAAGMPPGLEAVDPEAEDGGGGLVVERLVGLLGAVQFGALELHAWGCRRDRTDRPDRLVLDIDPDPAVAWPEVVAIAWDTAERLRRLGLESFVKVSGGKGLHVTVPIDRRTPWDTAHEFTRRFVRQWAGEQPSRVVATMSKAARRGRTFIDFHRNRRGATAVAPYSTRTTPRATVAAPVAWDELDALPGPDAWNVQNLPRRLSQLEADPWADIERIRQSITAAALRQVRRGSGA